MKEIPIAIRVRRKEVQNLKTMNKVSMTLCKKLKRIGYKNISYNHHKDPHSYRGTKYHIHLIGYINKESVEGLMEYLNKYIHGNSEWLPDYSSYKCYELSGKYGEVAVSGFTDDKHIRTYYTYMEKDMGVNRIYI